MIGIEGLANLTEDERVRFSFLFLAAFRVFETVYYQSKVGTVEEQLMQIVQGSVALLVRSPGGREWWGDNPFAFSSEFRNYVNQQLGKP